MGPVLPGMSQTHEVGLVPNAPGRSEKKHLAGKDGIPTLTQAKALFTQKNQGGLFKTRAYVQSPLSRMRSQGHTSDYKADDDN